MLKLKQLFRRSNPPLESTDAPEITFAEHVFAATGLSIKTVFAIGLIIVISALAIGYTVVSKEEFQRRQNQMSNTVVDTRTAEQKLTESFLFHPSFPDWSAVEQIGVLESRIKTCEEIFADPTNSMIAVDELIGLFGLMINIQAANKLDSEKTKVRLSELRQLALDSGDFSSVGLAEIMFVNAELTRLSFGGKLHDYQKFADSIIAIDDSSIQSLSTIENTRNLAINLYEKSDDREQDRKLLKLLGGKISKSPVEKIADIGRLLIDYPNFRDFFSGQANRSFFESETRHELLENLYDQLQKTPPQSFAGCKNLTKLLDSLYNPADVKYVLPLVERLQQSATSISTDFKAEIEQVLANVKRRASAVGAKVNLTGRDAFEFALSLSPEKNTVIIFLDLNQLTAGQTIQEILSSGRFDSWTTDFLVASTESIPDEELKKIAQAISQPPFKAKLLNTKTANRLMSTLGIDQVPIVVTVDQDNRVISFEK